MTTEVQTAFCSPWNGGAEAANIRSCSGKVYYFVAECGCHLILRTPRYIKREPLKAFACRQCRHERQTLQVGLPVSSYEAYAWQVVRSVFAGHMLVEVNVLGGRHGKADIWLPRCPASDGKLDLVIQVDGEGHTHYAMHGRSVAQQQCRDERFNDECWQQGLSLLRLHHADKLQWRWCVLIAIQACQCWPDNKFRWFSCSFERPAISEIRHAN